MGYSPKLLGQLRPGTTFNTSIYQPSAGYSAVVSQLSVVNNTLNTHTFRVHVDQDGSVADLTTALFYDSSVLPGRTHQVMDMQMPITVNGNIVIQCSSADALNFNLFGYEYLDITLGNGDKLYDRPKDELNVELAQVSPVFSNVPVNITGVNGGSMPATAANQWIVTDIAVCNFKNATHNFRFFYDKDGETFNDQSEIMNGQVGKFSTGYFTRLNWGIDELGALGIEADGANSLVFTIYGHQRPSRSF